MTGFVSPQAQRRLCLAGASWSFDRAAANLNEFCGLRVCDNTTREACHRHGGAMRGWQRDAPATQAALGEAEAAAWVEARRRTLLRGGATALLAELAEDRWADVRGYFGPHTEHTAYAARLAAGQAIGSGLVEGSCQPVIGRRLKQTAARWKVRRVERMAALCAVQASGQWDAYWAGAA